MNDSKKISKPSANIADILSVVRLLPPYIKLKDHNAVFSEKIQTDPDGFLSNLLKYNIDEKTLEKIHSEDLEDLDESGLAYLNEKLWAECHYERQALKECLLSLPEEFVAYIGFKDLTDDRLYEWFCILYSQFNLSLGKFLERLDDGLRFNLTYDDTNVKVDRYNRARDHHARLYTLLDYLDSRKHKTRTYSQALYLKRSRLFVIQDVQITDGKVYLVPDEFTEAFNGVEAERLRRCGNCKKVFWAKRIDMKGCSISCAKILRTRRWREKTTEKQRLKYKINRIEKSKKP